ncbi:unnamed protein product [Dicrocoelium dendriticum]|nr:unnamed protein product [Dicrocoelium dendriticum]
MVGSAALDAGRVEEDTCAQFRALHEKQLSTILSTFGNSIYSDNELAYPWPTSPLFYDITPLSPSETIVPRPGSTQYFHRSELDIVLEEATKGLKETKQTTAEQ